MDFSSMQLGLGFNLLMKTLPVLMIRLGAMLIFWVVGIVYLLLAGFIFLVLIGSLIDWLGVILFIVALALVIPAYNLFYKYVLFMIKAAHVAIMAEILVNGKIKDGSGQLAYGQARVKERFGEVNAMFVVDELVEAVVRAFTNTVYNIASWLPSDTLRTLADIVNRIIRNATNYVDEAVLARSFYNEAQGQNVWENARDGVVLYAQSWKPILSTAVVLMAISYIPAILAFVIFSAPIGGLIYLFNPEWAAVAVLLALLLAFVFKVAIGDSYAMATIIATYQKVTDGKTPDPAMAAKLDSVSDAFKDLKNRAMEAISPKPKATPAADTGTD